MVAGVEEVPWLKKPKVALTVKLFPKDERTLVSVLLLAELPLDEELVVLERTMLPPQLANTKGKERNGKTKLFFILGTL